MSQHERPVLVIADAVRIWGGAQRFVVDAAAGLCARGWTVHVLAYPGAPLAARARRDGIEVRTARTRANGAPWTVWPLRGWLERIEADLLLTTYEKDLRTCGLAARLASRDVAVVHSRECDAPLKDRPHIRWFHTRVADHVLFNSQATAKTTFESAPWLREERTSVVPKGIDVARWSRARPGPWREIDGGAGPVLGFAGQLVSRKQLDLLLEALAQLRHEPWTLRVAGEGPERERLVALARDLDLSDRVRWCGFVEEMPAWMKAVDIFVQPSREEGWGYVVAEAAAAGRRVVALDRSSTSEVLGHGAAGELVADTTSEGLAAAIGRVLAEDAGTRQRRCRQAEAWARAELGLDSMLDRLEDRLGSVFVRRRADRSLSSRAGR